MGRFDKVLDRILRGTSDNNIAFRDICWLLKRLEFTERIRGDHHIFSHDRVEEVLNLQPKGSKAKAYQVRQVREILTSYGFAGEEANGNSQRDQHDASDMQEIDPAEDEGHADDSSSV